MASDEFIIGKTNASNIRTVARLITAITEIDQLIHNEALPCAAYLKLRDEGGDIWQKFEAAGLAAREFLNNHNVTIEPKKGE